jgi:putative hydrolase of the HAD superfamily
MVNWDDIDTVLLDMDGTLLDLYFDNYFWQEYLPSAWAQKHDVGAEQAKKQLAPKFEEKIGTLSWYCVDHWSDELDINIMALKNDILDLIKPRPHAESFLGYLNSLDKEVVLVTNAHQKLVDLKFEHTGIKVHFDGVYSSHNLGHPKEDIEFWQHLSELMHYKPDRTLFIDDNLSVLRAAREFGIVNLLGICKPDSKGPVKDTEEFQGIDSFERLMI